MIASRLRRWSEGWLRWPAAAPRLSLVVVAYNMRRELPRTLFSLSPAYQQGVTASDYEVIVVDNGSAEPPTAEDVTGLGARYRYLRIDDASPSPANAINRGVALSRAPFVGIMIDGARIATPGVVRGALLALRRFERAVVGTVGFHLGPDTQMYSLRHGYNQTVEDERLERSDWPNHGYRLFEIGALAGSSPRAWLGAINESNLIFLPRALFDELGGYDERFTTPGGGLVNLDFYRRACDLPNSTLITLLGEATFHQVHGGAITNQPAAELPRRLQSYGEEYLRIRGTPFAASTRRPLLFGQVPPETLPWLQKACDLAVARLTDAPQNPLSLLGAGEAERSKSAAATRRGANPPTPGEEPAAWRAAAGGHDAAAILHLLRWLGLRQQHRVLELASDIPLGSLLVPYLQPGGYFGLDCTGRPPPQDLVERLDPEQRAVKQPRFAHSAEGHLDVFGRDAGFDFILALALFGHAGPTLIRRCLTSARLVLHPEGLLVATFRESATDQACDAWVYPDLNRYRWSTLASLCAELGLHCRKLDRPDPTRTWFAVAIRPQRLAAAPGSMPCS